MSNFESSKSELEIAYSQTIFSVFSPEDNVEIHIGDISKEIIALLNRYNADNGIVITGYNPRSELLSDEANNLRNQQLENDIKDTGCAYLKAVGQDKDKQWPPEDSFFVLNISEVKANELAEKYGQNAYVCVHKKIAPELIFTKVWNS